MKRLRAPVFALTSGRAAGRLVRVDSRQSGRRSPKRWLASASIRIGAIAVAPILLRPTAHAISAQDGVVNREPIHLQWSIGGEKREALLYAPEPKRGVKMPVVFVWHGHHADMRAAAEAFGIHRLWPGAIVAYPQGLPTPGKLADPEGKYSGWQFNVGEQADRDLRFFDAMIAALRADFEVDENRVYAMGHSNGGRFAQVLWQARGPVIAAVAVSASTCGDLVEALRRKPYMHVAGKKDGLVRFRDQERTMKAIRGLNGCGRRGEKIGGTVHGRLDLYASDYGTPVVTLIHDGGHDFPPTASALIVRFFRELVGRR